MVCFMNQYCFVLWLMLSSFCNTGDWIQFKIPAEFVPAVEFRCTAVMAVKWGAEVRCRDAWNQVCVYQPIPHISSIGLPILANFFFLNHYLYHCFIPSSLILKPKSLKLILKLQILHQPWKGKQVLWWSLIASYHQQSNTNSDFCFNHPVYHIMLSFHLLCDLNIFTFH